MAKTQTEDNLIVTDEDLQAIGEMEDEKNTVEEDLDAEESSESKEPEEVLDAGTCPNCGGDLERKAAK